MDNDFAIEVRGCSATEEEQRRCCNYQGDKYGYCIYVGDRGVGAYEFSVCKRGK